MIIDRLLLYVFAGITIGGTFGILLSAPTVFEGLVFEIGLFRYDKQVLVVDQDTIIKRLKHLYKTGGGVT